MIHDLSFCGLITIQFQCGCRIDLKVFFRENAVTMMERQVIPVERKLCNKHKDLKPSKINWISILEDVMKQHHCLTYLELLDEYDYAEINENIENFTLEG